jgi:hypothetical protein
MAAIKYTYSIQNNFPNHAENSDILTQEIAASSITVALDHIDTAGDVCDLWFKAGLTQGEETTLDGVIAAHLGVAPSKPIDLIRLCSPETSDGKPIFLPCLFPGNVFLYPTGAGDNIENGTRGNGQAFLMESTTEEDKSVEFQLMDWVYLAGGGIKWKDGEPGDWVSLLVYAPATPVTPNGNGTGNCNLVDPGVGQAILIVPAAGDGDYDVDLDDATPVPAYAEDEKGITVPSGFYEWSTPDIGIGTVTVGTPQNSNYNLFAIAIDLVRFANRLQLTDSGTQDLTIPAIKPKKILPHWKFKTTAHHAAGTTSFKIQWWLITARIKTV